MNILYQFNEKYAPYAGVSMTSLFENNKMAKSIFVYILGEDLSDDSIERFYKLAKSYRRVVKFIDTKALIEKMKALNMPTYRGSYAANMRLFVSDILTADEVIFEDVQDTNRKLKGDNSSGLLLGSDSGSDTENQIDSATGDSAEVGSQELSRMIYFDADTIITGSLEDLYNSDIDVVGMVYDSLGCAHKYSIGLNREDGYYNSGMILYDLDKWNEGDYTAKIIDHIVNVRAQYPSPDQDLLNVVLRGHITPVACEYNYHPHLKDYSYYQFIKVFKPYPYFNADEVARATSNPIVLHAYRYLGEFPWHKDSLHPFRQKFDLYLAMSPWHEYEKQASDGGTVMSIEKWMYRYLPQGLFLRIFKIMHSMFYKKADRLSKKNVISARM